MTTIQNLTLRRATGVGRLAELQRRAERVPDKPCPLAKSAINELSSALEALRAANEALEARMRDLANLRAHAKYTQNAFDEFVNLTPLAVLWTNQGGVIERGNDAASQLLNIGKHHLTGKPLMLFITDRSSLFAALHSLCDTGSPAVEIDVTVRPRERRPRSMKLHGRRPEHDRRCVWFLQESAVPVQAFE